MATTEEKQAKISEDMAASASKGALVEKVVFAGVPILFSCVVYLMNSLSSANSEIIQLKSKIAVVVNSENKAIPPQGTTIDMAVIREQLNDKIDKVERDAALARAAMTLDREKSMAAIERARLEMTADAAQARSSIRADAALARAYLEQKIALLEREIQSLKQGK
tara:strand:- start:156 stop:650 length:495 start_codon:yes stop_codon:yes gene_type:complete